MGHDPAGAVVVCHGKRCRKEQGDPARALRSIGGAAREGGLEVLVGDCLSACDDAPVVALTHGDAVRVWGRIAKDKHVLALCDVLAGRVVEPAERLRKRALEPSGKSLRRIARARAGRKTQ